PTARKRIRHHPQTVAPQGFSGIDHASVGGPALALVPSGSRGTTDLRSREKHMRSAGRLGFENDMMLTVGMTNFVIAALVLLLAGAPALAKQNDENRKLS